MTDKTEKHRPSSMTVKKNDEIRKQIQDLQILADLIDQYGVRRLHELMEMVKDEEVMEKAQNINETKNTTCCTKANLVKFSFI